MTESSPPVSASSSHPITSRRAIFLSSIVAVLASFACVKVTYEYVRASVRIVEAEVESSQHKGNLTAINEEEEGGKVHSITTTAAASSSSKDDEIVAYLTMGQAQRYPVLRNRFDQLQNTLLFFHSFDEPCSTGSSSTTGMNATSGNATTTSSCTYRKGTSFAEGRNLLVQTALNSNDKQRIKYFVVLDDDVELVCGEKLQTLSTAYKKNPQQVLHATVTQTSREKHNCWQSFTDMLLQNQTKHPFVKPLYTAIGRDMMDAFTIQYKSCNDENFKAYHRDYLWFFFPSTYYLEDMSWWLNGRSKFYLANRCWHDVFQVNGHWGIQNLHHSNYPRDERVDRIYDVLNYTFPQLGPWTPQLIRSMECNQKSIHPPRVQTIDPLCVQVLHQRYYQWLNGTFETEIPLPSSLNKTWSH